ncbi:MAG: ATP-dependent zinc metalloprotease FtsH [Acidobacteria bacterium]|nr:ATP-dependent zinc metalloprotease FtsH [Acidobacteriota bacterium]
MFSGQHRRLALIATAGVLALGAIIYFIATTQRDSTKEIAFSDFLRLVESGGVAEVMFADQAIDATLRSGAHVMTVPPVGYVAANPTLVPDLVRRQIRIVVRHPAEPGAYNLGALALAAAFLGLVGFTLYRVTSGRIPSLENKPRLASQDTAPITFKDVAGVDEAKDEVKEIVDFLKAPERFAAIGGRIPKGVLLVGPPGTGKTLLARSMAGEAGVPFLLSSGADFVEMYAGVGASRVRKLFREASRHKSCIIFIDELDAVGRRRGGNSLSHEEREQTLNQLLVEMDGFATRQGIVVVAATNRPDILDPALLRPGRVDRQVMVGCPDLKGREAILGVHCRKVALDGTVELRAIARGTPGLSGADLANLVNEAALLAARAGREKVTTADLEAARDKVLMGVERRSLALTEAERVNCAYHEAGHAVVAALLPHADPLHKVTIIPRGRALGVTMQLPEQDRHTHTKDYLQAQIAILMGGRVAEELFMNHMTSGASNDIERATDIAQKMVCELGMSSLGPMAFRHGSEDRPFTLSEDSARRVDSEVREIVMHGYHVAHDLLGSNREAVRALAAQLLEVESLDGSEILTILQSNGAPVQNGATAG